MPTSRTGHPGAATRRRTRIRPALSGAVCLLALAGTALSTAPRSTAAPRADRPGTGTGRPGSGTPGRTPGTDASRQSWRVDLSALGADGFNVRYSGGALGVSDRSLSPASLGRDRGYASAVLRAHHLDRPVNRVTVDLDAAVPVGASVVVDIRGRDAGGVWSEWRQATTGTPARLPRPVGDVQARLTLWSDKAGAAPVVRRLTLTADDTGASPAEPAASAFSARVYATREGLVGRTTANGHVITSDDHFVALPSRRALSPKGSGQYSVQVCGPARCETAPVWDVGPWNTHDDHWNPSTQREQWSDLPRGLPEAQAAHQDGYNDGEDEFGRRVANPAGIDLADGIFYNVGLNDNGWVTVTYLWTEGGDTKSFPAWGTDVPIPEATSLTPAGLPRTCAVLPACHRPAGRVVQERKAETFTSGR
ncbi:hypothetical protein ACH4ZX_29810 [Streptomyces sp. NPDC020490]|uniref:hypothetical protein n=1 Tax=Streptomyces sp. NPDC020490 TaxID=3365078 RepID=UPI00378A49D9